MSFEFVLMVYLVVNFFLSLVVAYIASEKGRNPVLFFFTSFFVSFLVGVLLVLAIPQRKSTPSGYSKEFSIDLSKKMGKCPDCAEWINLEAKVCKHCGVKVGIYFENILTDLNSERERKMVERERALEVRKIAIRSKLRKVAKSKYFKVSLAGGVIVAMILAGLQVSRMLTLSALIQEPSNAISLKSDWLEKIGKCGMPTEANYSGTTETGAIYGQYRRIADDDSTLVWYFLVTNNNESLNLILYSGNTTESQADCVARAIFDLNAADMNFSGYSRGLGNGFWYGGDTVNYRFGWNG